MTWIVMKNGKVHRKIVADSREAFEEIRRKYFPELPKDLWQQQKGEQQ